MDVLAIVALVAGLVGGGYLGWQLGVHNQSVTRKVFSDVKAGQLGDAVKDAQNPPKA